MKRIQFLVFSAFAFAALVTPALAAVDCSQAGTQLAMDQCAKKQHDRADAELNRVFRILSRKLTDEKVRASLRESERAWIAFRDRECDFEASGVSGGSIYPMIVDQCLTAEIQARIKKLGEMVDCGEGDPSCPR